MKDDVTKMYEGYWEGKTGLEQFEDYERNQVLKKLFKSEEMVLDLASGEGAVSEFLKNLGCEVTAFDISKEALKKAQKRGVKTVQGNVEEKLPFKDQTFDAVFWGDNVEHLFLPAKTLAEIKRVLKKDGRLIISTPNMGYWRYRLYYLFNGMVPQTEWYNINPWQWEHIRFFNQNVITSFLKQGGFKITDFFGVSSRRLDKPLMEYLPSLFGMIMVVVGQKND
jgi:methionine biosynthesis protein MetW